MHLLPHDKILARPDRYRVEFDPIKIQELANSIAENGLINLPVCDKPDDLAFVVAGERRVKAMKLLVTAGRSFSYLGTPIPPGQIPFALLGDLPELKRREIELDENIRRVDLSWQEQAVAVANLHALRTAQNPSWETRDTAQEVAEVRGRTVGSALTHNVNVQLLLAQQLHRPEVKSAKTLIEAQRAYYESIEAELKAELGKRVHVTRDDLALHHIGAIEGMLTLPNGTIDVIITDPPYGINAQGFEGISGAGIEHSYDDTWKTVQPLLTEFSRQAWRVAKPKAHAYIFCDVLRFLDLASILRGDGWDVWPRPIIWAKGEGHVPRPHHGPQRTYECILYALKGDKPTQFVGKDVIQMPAEPNRVHAAQKPVELYVKLLEPSVIAGDHVLDPFCGSGTVFVAASRLKLRAVGFDLDPVSVATAEERIRNL